MKACLLSSMCGGRKVKNGHQCMGDKCLLFKVQGPREMPVVRSYHVVVGRRLLI